MTPRRFPRPDRRLAAGLCAWLAVALSACLPVRAAAQERTPAPLPAFVLEVRAPDALRELLERHLELQRFRRVPDLDDAELARLLRLAEGDARALLAAQGYFNPRLDIRREPGEGGAPPRVVVQVEPGTAATVEAVDIGWAGDIATSTDRGAADLRRTIAERWLLPTGRPFTQDAWSDAKTGAVRELVARRYPAGQVADSLADVDAATGRARLGLKLDSGPLFRLGEMQVRGMQRYEPTLVPRLANLPPGSLYDQDQIQRAQLRLVGSGYFDSAFIYVDPEGPADPAPVQVNVREAPLKRTVLGVGVSTDSGPRASVEYTHNRLPGIGWRAVTKLQLERKSPFLQTELTGLPGPDLWRWGVLGRVERLDDGVLVTNGRRLRVGRTRLEEHIDRNVYLQYDQASVQAAAGAAPPSDTGDGSSLSANYIWNGRYFDRQPYPTRGYAIGAELGAGVTLEGTRSLFQRSVLRGQLVQPLQEGRLQWRAEAGAVLARDDARVPATQLFRTGGDTTVRGYGLREIGVQRPNGVVAPGRYLAVGSLEWQRPIRRGGVPTAYEGVLFADAGAVADRPGELRPAWGLGAGVRVRSPLGPIQVDLAYGVDVHRFRLHINLGTTF